MWSLLVASISLLPLTSATPSLFNPNPFNEALSKRQSSNIANPLKVDLGYSIYEGISNSSTKLNIFKGIRYAQPPIGNLRWQAPQPPLVNRSSVIQAKTYGSQCPQSPDNIGNITAELNQAPGSEDCLFLNLYTPQSASNLPVLVWIHGGGYGAGNGKVDFSSILNTNNNSFVAVSIQYRLGAFGFLSSDEVARNGIANAGLRDQTFALQWVQNYIHLFGGNSSQVTISGLSAGGGSVMLQSMAFGGELGTSLFSNGIAASPFLPMQYGYNDWVPSQSYYAFAQAVGCLPGYAVGSPAVSQSIFQCLVNADTATLKNASAFISSSGMYGTWGFLPVTDGKFIQQRPSVQLQQKKVNGLHMLTGVNFSFPSPFVTRTDSVSQNSALEGPSFTPQNITTEAGLVSWLEKTFPLFSKDDIASILVYYPGSDANDDPKAVDYATLGYTGATANNVSSVASGQQQRANNIYAETTFICPSYWLAQAFTNHNRHAYKYQYSIPPALHGQDTSAYLGVPDLTQGPDLVRALQVAWGNFITTNNPSVPGTIAAGAANSPATHNTTSTSANGTTTDANPITNWPPYSNAHPVMINLNQTGGVKQTVNRSLFMGETISIPVSVGPGLRNNFSLVDSFTWEGGRGVRCDFWRAMGGLVPE
ncbi:carboxylesterase type B [Tricladium varicosporioides]|nr:carboxylesterase type B [Hymenoscyphus varicosporioides]